MRIARWTALLAVVGGIVYLRYGLADGTPGTGDMSAPGRGIECND